MVYIFLSTFQVNTLKLLNKAHVAALLSGRRVRYTCCANTSFFLLSRYHRPDCVLVFTFLNIRIVFELRFCVVKIVVSGFEKEVLGVAAYLHLSGQS